MDAQHIPQAETGDRTVHPPTFIPEAPTVSNYIEAFKKAPFHIFFTNSVVVSFVVTALATLAIFTFIDTWGQFLWPLIVIKSPEKMTLQIGLALFSNQYFTDYGPLMAATLVSVLPLLIVFSILQRRVIESITLTGLKG